MADKTPDQLTAAAEADPTDLLVIYPTGGPMKKLTFSAFLAQVISGLGSAFLAVSNNLSDLASASSARANLGLGTAATLASSALFQVANNLSEVASAATARTNIGAAASDAPTIINGMTFSGSTKQNVQAVASTAIDVSASEFQTKSISSNTTFTFTNATAAKAQAFILVLTVSSGAVPTWPASVNWSGGAAPTFPNGENWVGFATVDGGTNWTGFVGAVAAA